MPSKSHTKQLFWNENLNFQSVWFSAMSATFSQDDEWKTLDQIFSMKSPTKNKKQTATTKAKQNTDQRKKENQKKKLKNICNNYRIIRFGKIPNQIFCFNLFSALSLLDNEDGHSWALRKFRISQLSKVQTNWQKKPNYLFGQKNDQNANLPLAVFGVSYCGYLARKLNAQINDKKAWQVLICLQGNQISQWIINGAVGLAVWAPGINFQMKYFTFSRCKLYFFSLSSLYRWVREIEKCLDNKRGKWKLIYVWETCCRILRNLIIHWK